MCKGILDELNSASRDQIEVKGKRSQKVTIVASTKKSQLTSLLSIAVFFLPLLFTSKFSFSFSKHRNVELSRLRIYLVRCVIACVHAYALRAL